MIGALEVVGGRGGDVNNVVAMGYCFGGAPHAFTVFGSQRYREEADSKSWKRFLEFLSEVR